MHYIVKILSLCIVVFLGFVIYGLFAPLKVHLKVTLEKTAATDYALELTADKFVGLALSGGGARAAVFGAAGMHELAKLGLLQDVSYVSSVSGGGFPASYWAINNMPETPGAEQDQYFKHMSQTVAKDYFNAIHWSQIKNPSRLMSPSRRLLSLQEGLQREGFLNVGSDATVANLPKDRAFFFNAVSYDTGRRFVISNHALPHPDNTAASRLPSAIRALSFSDGTTNRAAPAKFPISLAVATSAAFPPYLGPLTVEIDGPDGTEFWHLGDGGVLENPGVETLREAFYATDQRSGIIYSFDAGQRLQLDFSKADISIFSRDLVQFIDVILVYAGGHRDTLYGVLDEKLDLDLQTHTFDYLDVEALLNKGELNEKETKLWSNWDEWERISASTRKTAQTPAARLRLVPTEFNISEDDKQLMEAAAKTLVSHKFGSWR